MESIFEYFANQTTNERTYSSSTKPVKSGNTKSSTHNSANSSGKRKEANIKQDFLGLITFIEFPEIFLKTQQNNDDCTSNTNFVSYCNKLEISPRFRQIRISCLVNFFFPKSSFILFASFRDLLPVIVSITHFIMNTISFKIMLMQLIILITFIMSIRT